MESFLQFNSRAYDSHSPAYHIESGSDDAAHDQQFEEIIQDGKKRHLCLYPGCGKIFRFKSEIIRHHVIHFTSRPYTCSFEGCGKSFKRPDALDSHMRIHIKDLPFACEFSNCEMRFPTKMALKQHTTRHESNRSVKIEQSTSYSSYEPYSKSLKTEAPFYSRQEQVGPIMGNTTLPQPRKETYNTYSQSPAQRFATGAEWETKNPDDLKSLLMKECAEGSEYCEIIVKKIINENMMLKEKLTQCNDIVNNVQQTQQISDFLPNEVPEDALELPLDDYLDHEEVQDQEQEQDQAELEPELSTFFGDDSDAVFLAFLKEREASFTENIF